jgi:hypothetical protein
VPPLAFSSARFLSILCGVLRTIGVAAVLVCSMVSVNRSANYETFAPYPTTYSDSQACAYWSPYR